MDLTWPTQHSVMGLWKHDGAAGLTRSLLANCLMLWTALLSLFSPHIKMFLCVPNVEWPTDTVPTLLERGRWTMKPVTAHPKECFLGEVQVLWMGELSVHQTFSRRVGKGFPKKVTLKWNSEGQRGMGPCTTCTEYTHIFQGWKETRS